MEMLSIDFDAICCYPAPAAVNDPYQCDGEFIGEAKWCIADLGLRFRDCVFIINEKIHTFAQTWLNRNNFLNVIRYKTSPIIDPKLGTKNAVARWHIHPDLSVTTVDYTGKTKKSHCKDWLKARAKIQSERELEPQYETNIKRYFRLVHDFTGPKFWIPQGEVKTELEWIKTFDLEWGDCDKKDHWFEDRTPAALKIETLDDAFAAEHQRIRNLHLDTDCESQTKAYRNLVVAPKRPTAKPDEKWQMFYDVQSDNLYRYGPDDDDENRWHSLFSSASTNNPILRWHRQQYLKKQLSEL